MLILQKKTGTAANSPWDLADISFEGSFSVTTQDALPRGVQMKSDGTKMYVTGTNSKNIHQYTLSPAWDATSASYDSVSHAVGSEDLAPYGLALKPDGTKMYIIGGFANSVFQYTLSVAWDMSTASYDSISYNLGAISPSEVRFRTDGTKMYIASAVAPSVRQYTLSTPWNVSTASYDSVSFGVGPQEPSLLGIDLQTDGSKLFIVGNSSDSIHQYTLSTPWLISSGSHDKSHLISAQDNSPVALTFKTDGGKVYVAGSQNANIYQYGL